MSHHKTKISVNNALILWVSKQEQRSLIRPLLSESVKFTDEWPFGMAITV
jgi:hypothetical protein